MSQSIAEYFIEREDNTLSQYAFKTVNTKGREHPYNPSTYRTEFQRDRDKIIHSKAFRRLTHKTQVFLMPKDEHFRTRMTHTLEVTQIARIIARALRLNEDLCEAAALGHDLGHTPFGHAGEKVMRKCFSPDFSHSAQSVRVCELLENDGRGLNLTYEVRDAILNHTGGDMACTLEGVIVKYADRIAYINHDIDDACRGGVISLDDIPKELLNTLGRKHSERINTMVTSIVEASSDKPFIRMTDEVQEATDELRAYMFKNVYVNSVAKAEEDRSMVLLESLFNHFMLHTGDMPELYRQILEKEGDKRAVCDFLSGMTDRYAIELFTNLFVPKVWTGK